jgi:UDP-3-O-[3-hydroxymyristoyl] glucosamine N-acyltransferase
MFYAHPTAVREEGAEIGEGTRIWHFVHVRKGARIGKNCNIGKDVYIDVGVEIGDRVKIQNCVSLYRSVKIEDDVFIGPHVVFTNDLYPRAFSENWEGCCNPL